MLISSFFRSVADCLESAKTLLNKPLDRMISTASSLSERHNFHSAESEKFSHTYLFPENYSVEDQFKMWEYLTDERHALYNQGILSRCRSPNYVLSTDHKRLGIKVEFDSLEELIHFRKNTYDFTNIKPQEKAEFSPHP